MTDGIGGPLQLSVTEGRPPPIMKNNPPPLKTAGQALASAPEPQHQKGTDDGRYV